MDKKVGYIVVIVLLLLCVGCLGGYIFIEMNPFDYKDVSVDSGENKDNQVVTLDITNGNVISLFNKAHYTSIGPSAPLYRDGGYKVSDMSNDEKIVLLSRQWYPEVQETITGTDTSYHYELDEEVLRNLYNSFYGVNTYQSVSSISNGCLTLTLDSQSGKYVYDGTGGCGGTSNFQVQEEIIKAVNAGFSKIVFLKSESLTVDFVDTLRKRYLTVWAEDGDVTTVSAVKTILTGANGIAADSLQVYSEVYEDFFGKQNSIVRKSFFIGHRGSGATEGGYSVFGPENTLESAKKAYADGADYVEVDVHFTLDKELVIMHDSSLGTMMDATGTVETTSYADLKSYTYKNYDDSYRIPTLRQFIEYFKQTNCMLVIELKDYSKELADAVVALVREYNFENQCVIICFSKPSLGYVYENEPSIGLGALSSEDFRVYEKIYDEKHDVYKNGDFDLSQTLRGLFKSVQNYNCVYNPGYNVVTEEMIQQIQLRGLGVQVWTLQDSSLLEQFMMRGCASLTIDGVAMISDMIRSISANQTEYRTAVGEEAEVKLLGEYYSRSDYEGNKTSAADLTDDANAEPVLISGDAFELTDGNSWKAVKEGTSVAMYRYKMFSTAGQYYIYSQPFTLVAENRSEKGQGCSSVLDIPGLHWVGESLLVVTAVIILIRKRKSQ